MPNAPAEYRSFLKILIAAMSVLTIGFAYFIVINQKGFSSGVYDRNQLTTFEGVIISHPFPAIKTFYGKDIYGNPLVKTFPLVNKGKFGADSLLADLGRKKNIDWKNSWVQLKGKLIYNHGITIIETAEGENAFTSIQRITTDQQKQIPHPVVEEMDSVTLHGEIIDPKCYLGVMKPGQGKPHSDCAIRCISGGIPPLLMIKNLKGEETFFVLRGRNDEAINQQILFAIGQPVTVTGKLKQFDDWMVLEIDPFTGIYFDHK